MKKVIYALILPLLVVSGLVFANRQTKNAISKDVKNETTKKPAPKPPTAAEQAAATKAWEATPQGIAYKKWETSAEGQKVLTGSAKINKYIRDSIGMEAVVTSLSLPPNSYLGFGVMVKIDGDDYILRFDADNNKELQDLPNLKVNDKIIVKSRAVSHAPKYEYPIISGEYAERDHKVIYKHPPRKRGC